MEKNTDDRIVVLDKDMYRRLVSYAECGERDCGPNFFGKTVEEIKTHATKFNVHLQAAAYTEKRQKNLFKEEKRKLRKKARRLSSQRDIVRYMLDHVHQVVFPVMVIGVSAYGEYRLKYRSLSDGWESDCLAELIIETAEELPKHYRVVREGEVIE